MSDPLTCCSCSRNLWKSCRWTAEAFGWSVFLEQRERKKLANFLMEEKGEQISAKSGPQVDMATELNLSRSWTQNLVKTLLKAMGG